MKNTSPKEEIYIEYNNDEGAKARFIDFLFTCILDNNILKED